MENTQAFWMILVIAGVTFLTRLLPFLIFPASKQPPKMVAYLSNVLPAAVMGMLVVYCLKGVSPLTYPHGLPELIAIVLVVGSYIWKRNTLLSVLIGTIAYMLLIQWIFVI
ncbi:MAG: AzlD domain-containing protein [Lachnospiraceae bacterium]|nr:AzlD domain-containing protein [Lachnospiraceae bacterium]